jgi:hypothetical protein
LDSIDETGCWTAAIGFLILAVKGAESILCRITNDAKEGVTGGEALPLSVIGNNKTPRFLAHDQD